MAQEVPVRLVLQDDGRRDEPAPERQLHATGDLRAGAHPQLPRGRRQQTIQNSKECVEPAVVQAEIPAQGEEQGQEVLGHLNSQRIQAAPVNESNFLSQTIEFNAAINTIQGRQMSTHLMICISVVYPDPFHSRNRSVDPDPDPDQNETDPQVTLICLTHLIRYHRRNWFA